MHPFFINKELQKLSIMRELCIKLPEKYEGTINADARSALKISELLQSSTCAQCVCRGKYAFLLLSVNYLARLLMLLEPMMILQHGFSSFFAVVFSKSHLNTCRIYVSNVLIEGTNQYFLDKLLKQTCHLIYKI